MLNPEELLHARNSQKIGQLMNDPETQKIFAMLSQTTGGGLEQAADKASKGDTTQLVSAIRQLMQNPEAAKLMENMKRKLD